MLRLTKVDEDLIALRSHSSISLGITVRCEEIHDHALSALVRVRAAILLRNLSCQTQSMEKLIEGEQRRKLRDDPSPEQIPPPEWNVDEYCVNSLSYNCWSEDTMALSAV